MKHRTSLDKAYFFLIQYFMPQRTTLRDGQLKTKRNTKIITFIYKKELDMGLKSCLFIKTELIYCHYVNPSQDVIELRVAKILAFEKSF